MRSIHHKMTSEWNLEVSESYCLSCHALDAFLPIPVRIPLLILAEYLLVTPCIVNALCLLFVIPYHSFHIISTDTMSSETETSLIHGQEAQDEVMMEGDEEDQVAGGEDGKFSFTNVWPFPIPILVTGAPEEPSTTIAMEPQGNEMKGR